ncbi:DNA-directed RNA polymerase subunit beta' [Candidatus Berkelbacteria bacterium]|nr:DNA-directed RNA polymerase subunit beta' [Candidatus Berkelbacteria bacterium]
MVNLAQKGKRTNESILRLTDFNSVRISVASPEKISAWSYGEVLKPETINYRTQKPERDGLFDERIFGPTKDWECYCGKYKKIRYKGVICDKCGVEVTRSSVRRERMGHIELASPVSHIWYVRGIPSALSQLLDLSVADLEKVIYFAGFIVLEIDEELRSELLIQLEGEYQELVGDSQLNDTQKREIETAYRQTKQELASLKKYTILSEEKYQQISLKYGNVIRVGIGAEAILELLKELNLDAIMKDLSAKIEEAGETVRRRYVKRLQLLKQISSAGIKPEWFVMTRIPVIPPDLRPMVQLDGGRFAASDLNDLYRRVLNRNNRLKKLLAQGAPEVICRNEKRMLQEAIDSLIDNSARRGRAVNAGATQRRLRSLSDMLRGKQGRFRQNLLGKRVDYSGRSVIVVGPELKLNQCGLPKTMALELFKPFVISRLIQEGYIQNVKNAARLIERGAPEVWDALEQVTAEKFVLLNRAPTLHRLGIQAFKPVLIEGKAIQLHPLACLAFNADFDGDQMAVHVPLSSQAQWESSEIMQSKKNLLKPASGEPIVTPRLDMVYGVYYLTTFQENVRGEGKAFSGKNETILAYQMGNLHIRAKIRVLLAPKEGATPKIMETSVGRILFNNVIPKELRYLNESMDAKALKKLIFQCFKLLGGDATAETVDKIKKIGFEHALLSGMSISMNDIQIPDAKYKIVQETRSDLEKIQEQYHFGLITDDERRIQTIRLWEKARDLIGAKVVEGYDVNGPVFIAVKSGARGSTTQLNQMAGMKGLVVNPSGEIIETAITSNFKEGLTELEYFTSTHAARKGKSDTALRTSDSGYLTRRLVDVAQDVIVEIADCGSDTGIEVKRADADELNIDYASRLIGRFSLQAIKVTGKKIIDKDQEIDEVAARLITESEIESVSVRSPLNCRAEWGLCQKCYGRDLATGELIELGEVVGIMAAQAIGEPGTQLTLDTFHSGGVATGEDVTTGLPRVEELFEARSPKSPAIMSDIEGAIRISDRKNGTIIRVASEELRSETHDIPEGYEIIVKDNELVNPKQAIASAIDKKALRSLLGGKVVLKGKTVMIQATEPLVKEYPLTSTQSAKVKTGEKVIRGQALTEGHLDLQKLLEYQGLEAARKYIVHEIQQIYSSQGQEVNDKHIEIILRQMFSKVQILDGADSKYLMGQIIERRSIERENEKLKVKGKKLIRFNDTLFGVTRIALTTDSFLSAASFQETTSVLIDAAVRGAIDPLRGLKENVIIGRLIPAGTGFRKRLKEKAKH